MVFIPSSLVTHKRKLETISCLAQTLFLILCVLVHSNQAGVIKKRDNTITATRVGDIGLVDLKETEVVPTTLTALNNASSIVTTKLQSVVGSNFATEASKELTNNVISINEDKHLLEVADKINFKNETELKTNNEEENSKAKDFKPIIENFENMAGSLNETPKTTTEFSSNDIKEEKMPKLLDKQLVGSSKDQRDSSDYENASSLENTLKIVDSNPRPPSKILTELITETEKYLTKSKDEKQQIENRIETNKEHKDNKENTFMLLDQVTIKPFALTTLKAITNSSGTSSQDKEKESQLKSLETSTSVSKVTDNLQILQASTTVPLKDSVSKNKNNYLESLAELDSAEHQSNKIREDLDRHVLHKSNKDIVMSLTTTPSLLNLDKDKLKPLTREQDLLVFEGNKKKYVRSMFMEETTTISFRETDELLTPVTTFKPPILRIKEGIEDTTQENLKDQVDDFNTTNLAHLNVKEKKPKFISDNSTNAQQLNLPNNAEAWSLAAMKSLPKANITIETAQTLNQTNKEFKENILHNNSFTVSHNSEKNLLDWSQIMMDKELSTTTRNEDYKSLQEIEAENEKQNNLTNKENRADDLKSAMNITTLMPDIEVTKFKIQPRENMVTKNSLMELEQTTSTISSVPTSTILSGINFNKNDNENINRPDKKVEENMNNHIDSFTATLTTTTVATNADNNPFNTSLNIEPNLSEINLTLNQTQDDLNNDVHNIATSGNKSVDDDVNANAYIEISTVAATLTSSTTTTATAVVDMTTVEQISSETTTVSTLETAKQYVPLNNVVISQQEQNKNKISNVIYEESNSSLPISHNELENTVVDKQNNQNEIIDLNTKTTTFVPITTFRPTILAITSTTSTPATFEQEVDQNRNEIQSNLTNTEQQSIIKTDFYLYNNTTKTNETHLIKTEFETTTTLETFTTPSTVTAEIKANEIENTLTTTATATATSSTEDEVNINETTEIYLDSSDTPTTTTTTTISTQTTPKQVDEHNNRGGIETTTGSSVSTDEKFEKDSKTNTATETNSFSNTSTETPVVTASNGGKALVENITTTSTTTTEQNIIVSTTAKQENDIKKNILSEEDAKIETTTKTIMNNTQEITTTTMPMPATAIKEEETYIGLLDDTSTTTTTHTYSSTISTTDTSYTPTKTMTMATTTTTSPPSQSSTLPSAIATNVAEIYNVINSTTTELIKTTTQQLLTEIEEESSSDPSSSTTSTYYKEMLPPATTTSSSQVIHTADIGNALPTLTSIMGVNSGNMYPKNSESGETDVNVIIAITVSVIGIVALILLVGFLYLMRKRQKQTSYSQRCRPVSLDEYTIDNASVSGSMRKSSALRASKRTYGNLAFDDPALRPNPLTAHELAKFVQEKLRIFEEFRDVPQITSRLDEVPTGCEDKNRYANVLPLPETRVILQRLNDDEKSEYINANYVTGPKDLPNYYIACQAPLESTVEDFWRMIWEQQSRVIIQATDLIENGIEKCAEYLPPSVTLDNHSSFGDFQITLQNREIKDKYAISTILLKHVGENAARELTHYWYKWPEVGVPSEEAPIIAMLLEARSSLISYAIEQANEDKDKSLKSAEEGAVPANDSSTLPTSNSNGSSANGSSGEINGNISMVPIKKTARNQGPLTIHCSPGTGRTGTIIGCDIAIRSLETPKRTVDIPQIVYYVRRGRASAVLTKEQYEFIYKVANMYAAKITNPTNYN